LEAIAVPKELLNETWPFVLRFIQEPLLHEQGDLTPEKVYNYIEDGTFILLVCVDKGNIKAALTLEVIQKPTARIMNLVTTGGTEIDAWQDVMSDTVDIIAKENNCNFIHTRGRLGWLKQLKRNGYKPLYFIASKEV